jgi:hypothetical protein
MRRAPDGKIYGNCPGCGTEVELKSLPAGMIQCPNPRCKSHFPYNLAGKFPPAIPRNIRTGTQG